MRSSRCTIKCGAAPATCSQSQWGSLLICPPGLLKSPHSAVESAAASPLLCAIRPCRVPSSAWKWTRTKRSACQCGCAGRSSTIAQWGQPNLTSSGTYQQLAQPPSVVGTGEPVPEDARSLMQPQARQLLARRDGPGCCEQHALNHLKGIAAAETSDVSRAGSDKFLQSATVQREVSASSLIGFTPLTSPAG